MRIAVIGESNIDIATVQSETTKTYTYFGGVARNIAHNLSLLGHEVQLVSVFADDDYAKTLISQCRELGIDLSLSTQYENAKSPIFYSCTDQYGHLLSVNPQVELNSRMDLEWLKSKMDEINRSDMVVVDTLLSAEALSHLIDHCEKPLYMDTVSPKKATRLHEAITMSGKKHLFALKCNHAEATAITGETDAFEAAKRLNGMGIINVYLTLGADGVLYYAEGKVSHHKALPVDVVNVTGSGDAFLAGVVHANALGCWGKEAVMFGLKAAQHNIKSEAPVNPTLRHSIFRV